MDNPWEREPARRKFTRLVGPQPGRPEPGPAGRRSSAAFLRALLPALPATWNLLPSTEKERKKRKHFLGGVISFPAFGRWWLNSKYRNISGDLGNTG